MRKTSALILSLLIALQVVAQGADVFHSPTAGFQITKPNTWHYATAEQNAANLAATKLSDEELKAAMLKYATTPLVILTKHAEPYPDLNPSVKVNIRPLGNLKGRPPVDILRLILPQLERAFRDVQIVQQPATVSVGGLKAGHARIHYSLRTSDDQVFPTASEIWIVPRGDFFFMIGAGTRQDEKTGSRSEIAEIVNSIRLDR